MCGVPKKMFTQKKTEKLFRKFENHEHDRVHKRILGLLEDFNTRVYVTFKGKYIDEIDTFLEFFFRLIVRKDFRLERYVQQYLSYITLLENLTYLSRFKKTEEIMDELLKDPDSEAAKVLLVLNLKNDIDFSIIDRIFEHNSILGSYWLYSVYSRHFFCHEKVFHNLQVLQERLLMYEL